MFRKSLTIAAMLVLPALIGVKNKSVRLLAQSAYFLLPIRGLSLIYAYKQREGKMLKNGTTPNGWVYMAMFLNIGIVNKLLIDELIKGELMAQCIEKLSKEYPDIKFEI